MAYTPSLRILQRRQPRGASSDPPTEVISERAAAPKGRPHSGTVTYRGQGSAAEGLPRGKAPNMLWLTQLEYFGLERPAYLSRVS